MSSENLDSESGRSRSIFHQVRETIGGMSRSRHRVDARMESDPLTLVNSKCSSADHENVQMKRKKSTPNAFSQHLSLLNQVKSRIQKTKTSPRLSLSVECENQPRPSLPPIISISESKSITPLDLSQDLPVREVDLPISETLINSTTQNIDEQFLAPFNSLDMWTPEEENSQSDVNRTSSPNRKHFSRLKDQLAQCARTVLNRSPSLTSVVTNTSTTGGSLDIIYWLELSIERGKDLSIKDLNGTSDPYVKVYYGTEEKYTTNTVYKNLNPIWKEKMSFFVYDLNLPIYFHLFDYDRIGRDESMGSAKIDLGQIPLENVYHATLDLENEKRTDGKIGMIKISLTITSKTSEFHEEVMRTLAKQVNRKPSLTPRFATSYPTMLTRRTIDVFIIEGRNLLGPSGINKLYNPYIRLKFGTNKKYRTQTIKSTTNPKWRQSFIYDIVSNDLPPFELSVIDDTGGFGDFMGRGTCNFTHLDEEQTHQISLDLDENAGVIDLFVTITGITPVPDVVNDTDTSSNIVLDTIPSKLTEEDMETYSFLATLRSIKPMFDVGKVEIKIYQARDLSAKDINGKSDPFCVVELDSTRLRTHTIFKTLDPVWNKSFLIPVQDIHSVLELTIFDEDANKSMEFIGKVAMPLLAIKNGERKWIALKDRKCNLPVKGIIEIEATLIYTNLRAIIRTFNPRQMRYYQQDGKFRVGVFKQHINRVRLMLRSVVNVAKFIDCCFQWENPVLSFCAFIISVVIVWNFELYMLPCALLLVFGWNAVVEYRRGLLGKSFTTLGDETISAMIQPTAVDEDILDSDVNNKEQKRSLMGVIHGVQDTVLEIQGYIDVVASTLERVKNLFNFTVPWLSILAIILLTIISILLYYIPVRYLVLAFIINKFTKRFRKPKGYIDNNELADFVSRLPSDPELLQYRECKILSLIPTPKRNKRATPTNGK